MSVSACVQKASFSSPSFVEGRPKSVRKSTAKEHCHAVCVISGEAFSQRGDIGKTNGTDVWALPLFGDRKAFPVVQAPRTRTGGSSHRTANGSLTLRTNRAGRNSTPVRFPDGSGKRQLSTSGGIASFWPTGKELFYTQPDGHVIGVELDTRAENLAVGNSRQLFGGRVLESTTVSSSPLIVSAGRSPSPSKSPMPHHLS